MVAHPRLARAGRPWFDHDQVHRRRSVPPRAGRPGTACGKRRSRTPEVPLLDGREGLFDQPVVARASRSHFDDDEPSRRPRVERQDVDLVTADPDVSAQHAPASVCEALGHEGLGRGTAGRRTRPRPPGSRLRVFHAGQSGRGGSPRTHRRIAADVGRPRLPERPPPQPGSPSPVSSSATSAGVSSETSQIPSCSMSAHEANVRRWIGVSPSAASPARCSGAA